MTAALLAAADSALAIRAGWTVLLMLWGTTAVALLLAGWLTLSPRVPAERQHRAALVALLGCVVLLVAIPLMSLRLGPPARSAFSVAPEPVSPRAATPASAASPARPADAQPSFPASPNRLAGVVGIVWVAGIAVLFARLAGGSIVAQQVRRRAAVVEEPSVRGALDRARRHAGVVEPVSLRRSAEIEAPVVLGARRPALLLPGDLARQLPEEALAPLLAHECAHIARHDYAFNLAQSVVDALLFFSPAVHWISQRLREAREFCCDDAALTFCGRTGDATCAC